MKCDKNRDRLHVGLPFLLLLKLHNYHEKTQADLLEDKQPCKERPCLSQLTQNHGRAQLRLAEPIPIWSPLDSWINKVVVAKQNLINAGKTKRHWRKNEEEFIKVEKNKEHLFENKKIECWERGFRSNTRERSDNEEEGETIRFTGRLVVTLKSSVIKQLWRMACSEEMEL